MQNIGKMITAIASLIAIATGGMALMKYFEPVEQPPPPPPKPFLEQITGEYSLKDWSVENNLINSAQNKVSGGRLSITSDGVAEWIVKFEHSAHVTARAEIDTIKRELDPTLGGQYNEGKNLHRVFHTDEHLKSNALSMALRGWSGFGDARDHLKIRTSGSSTIVFENSRSKLVWSK